MPTIGRIYPFEKSGRPPASVQHLTDRQKLLQKASQLQALYGSLSPEDRAELKKRKAAATIQRNVLKHHRSKHRGGTRRRRHRTHRYTRRR